MGILNMRSAVLALAFIGASVAVDVDFENAHHFVSWMARHNKNYKTLTEFSMRQANWMRKDKFIKDFYETNHSESFNVGHNLFSDLTKEEFKSQYTGISNGLGAQTIVPKTPTTLPSKTIPVSFDWREHHKVTPVKDQAQCGSCWTFATVATLEGAHAIKTGQLLSFAEQQFVSCVPEEVYGCAGCMGGDTWAAYQYWLDQENFLILESNYRYEAVNVTCDYDSKGKTRVQIDNYYSVPMNDSSQLLQYLAQGPVALYIDAGQDVFSSYKNGILDSDDCFTEIDHGVTGVGYGVSPSGVSYTIVKNSWSNSWGENGYIRIKNVDGWGICGMNSSPYQPMTKESD